MPVIVAIWTATIVVVTLKLCAMIFDRIDRKDK
jgi:hypothetical protein